MHHSVDPRQPLLFDPYAAVFSPLAYRHIQEGWQGVFRHVLLELMPVQALAGHFSRDLGRPTKELYSMAGLQLCPCQQDHEKTAPNQSKSRQPSHIKPSKLH